MSGQIDEMLHRLHQVKQEIKNCYPAFDELLQYALERRHLDMPEVRGLVMDDEIQDNLRDYLSGNVRLIQIDEISFDIDEKLHLPGVESSLSAMKNSGVSLIFLVQGSADSARVYMGVSNFAPAENDAIYTKRVNDAARAMGAVVKANFPGSRLRELDNSSVQEIARKILDSNHVGTLTGIPSLKREEDSRLFVQGLERLIRAMRGMEYTWLSIADPIPLESIDYAVNSCHRLQSDIHSFVKTTLSDAEAKANSLQLGLFGMKGIGSSDGDSHTDSFSETLTAMESDAQNYKNWNQRAEDAGAAIGGIGAIAGGIIGQIVCPIPGVGAMLGATVGSLAGVIVRGITNAITAKNGYSHTTGSSIAQTRGFSDTTSHAIMNQLAAGAFGSKGLSWTQTTTVGKEQLNRKAEYVEEILKKYEERLLEGRTLGMWNLGHYFCTKRQDTYEQGSGVITSLFSGMDSTYEPPRNIRMEKRTAEILCKFSNIYFYYGSGGITKEKLENKSQKFTLHPLGLVFNGPATPVNTRELAIITPFATQDVEGMSVTKRASFSIHIPEYTNAPNGEKFVLGAVMDKGNELASKYRLNASGLTKHLAVFGLTGSGKTNTVHHLLTKLWKAKIPFLVIEPAKAEYRALAELDDLKDDLLIISAGVDQSEVCPLRLNPFFFNPGKNDDKNRVHVLTHIDRLKSTFNAVFPMYGPMPYILEEAILQIYRERGWDLGRSVNKYVDIYTEDFSDYIPTLNDLCLKVDSIVKSKGYFQEQQMNIQAALKSRLQSLMVGAKGSMFNCRNSISDEELWNRPVVIELENMGDDDEKAFLMGLLVSRLYEYRKASFSDGELKHLLVIEEAHRLLTNVPESTASMESSNVKGKAVSAFVDMLTEVRSYGQSVVVVDQLPSRVSPNIVKGTGAKIVHRLLAKDDREAVGETMGLTPEQISDMSLLRTGECVVSQDGDAKAFLCRIPKNDAHTERKGGEVSAFTKRFIAEHKELLAPQEDSINLEDDRVYDAICKVMLSIGTGIQDVADLSRTMEIFCSAEEVKHATFSYYWKKIMQDLWAYYHGDYRLYLRMYQLGEMLCEQPFEVEKYVESVRHYIMSTNAYTFSESRAWEGVLFLYMCERCHIAEYLNKHFDNLLSFDDHHVRLSEALRRVIPLLHITGDIRLHKKIQELIVRELLSLMKLSKDRQDHIINIYKQWSV